MPRWGHGGEGLYAGMSYSEWSERRAAEQELRSALYDIRSRSDMLNIDLDEIDLPSARKADLSQMSAAEIYAAAEDVRAEVRSAEYEYFDQVAENGTASELVEALLDLAGTKEAKRALRERLNADSNDIIKLADELLSIDKPERASYLRADTRDMMQQKRAAEQQLLSGTEFMAAVEEGAKSWIK